MSIVDEDRSGAGTADGTAGAGAGHPREGNQTATRPGALRWLLRREAVANLVLVVVMISVVWAGIGLHLREQRALAVARAEQESGNLAQAAAASIGQTIASVDDALRFMRAIYTADPKHFDIGAWTNRANQTRSVALEFTLIDRDGQLLASSLSPAATAGDFSHADFFTASTEAAHDRLLIGQPIAGRIAGRWSLPFTRKVTAADGWLMGVIVAAVDPSWLTGLYRSLETGRGALMLVGADGGIRALALGSAPDSTPGIGMRIDLPGLLGTPGNADTGTRSWINPVDATEQVVSYQRLPDYNAYVIFGLDSAEAFAPYRLYARQYELFGAGITLLILITGGLLLNNTRRLLKSRQMLRDSMDAISQGIVMVDGDGRMPVINRRAGEMLHIAAKGAPPLTPDVALLPAPDGPADRPYEETRPDGTVLEICTHALSGGAVVRTYADITERKRAEALILHLAMHDSLTGLPNRRLLTDRLAEELVKARDGGRVGAVLLVDLDRFKTINDGRGHAFGDRVLGLAADRLRDILRGAELAARIGGDEFCILLPGQDKPATLAARAAALLQQIAEPAQIAGQEVLLSASIGIACYPHDGTSVDQLLTRADIALFRAKEGGRATFRLYEPEMDARIAERRQLERELQDAVAQGQLAAFYQPIVDAETGETVGFEALLRWFHPARGEIPPSLFIPAAEECGLMVQLGYWILEAACAEAATWPAPLRVSVNLSPRQFWRSDFATRVAAILVETGLPPERLVLEVTEGVLIDNRDRALAAITALSRQGIRIALDDFGTGYSSLSYLHQFPFDSIKIDRSFISTLCEDENSQAIVRAIVTLGRSLHLKVIAEGVETPPQLCWLRDEGCAEVQGYLLGRPMPAEQVRERMAHAQRPLADAAHPL